MMIFLLYIKIFGRSYITTKLLFVLAFNFALSLSSVYNFILFKALRVLNIFGKKREMK